MSGSMFIGHILLPFLGLVVAAGPVLASLPRRGRDKAARAAGLALRLGIFRPGSGNRFVEHGAARKPGDPPVILAKGHVAAHPDAEVVVGAEMAGTVTRVMVQEKSVVHKGDLLLLLRSDEIRPRPMKPWPM